MRSGTTLRRAPQQRRASRVSLRSVATQYLQHLESNGTKASTIADYKGYLEGHLVPYFGDVPLRASGSVTSRTSSATSAPRPGRSASTRTASSALGWPDRPSRITSTTCTQSSPSRSAARTSRPTRSRRQRSRSRRSRPQTSPSSRPLKSTPSSTPWPTTICDRRTARSSSRRR